MAIRHIVRTVFTQRFLSWPYFVFWPYFGLESFNHLKAAGVNKIFENKIIKKLGYAYN